MALRSADELPRPVSLERHAILYSEPQDPPPSSSSSSSSSPSSSAASAPAVCADAPHGVHMEELAVGEVDYESLPTHHLWQHLVAGAMAGMMEHCCMYPVDFVKTRMMALVPAPEANYRNLFQAFSKIIRTEHTQALFRGISVVASGAGPAHALYFSCYEFSKKALTKANTHSTVLAQGGAGAIATLVHDGFMNPIDVVKQRLQVYHSPYRGTFHCISSVYRNEGLGAFYRSYTTQLSMNIPFQVTHFVTYEFQQDIFNPTRTYYPLSHMLSGAGAGAFASIITNPLDVSKTLLNTCEQSKYLRRDQRIHGVFGALTKIYQTAGVRGFFKGLTPRVVYQSPSTAICWSVYEFFKYVFGLKEEEEKRTAFINSNNIDSR